MQDIIIEVMFLLTHLVNDVINVNVIINDYNDRYLMSLPSNNEPYIYPHQGAQALPDRTVLSSMDIS